MVRGPFRLTRGSPAGIRCFQGAGLGISVDTFTRGAAGTLSPHLPYAFLPHLGGAALLKNLLHGNTPPEGPLLSPSPPLLLQRIYPAIASADPAECWLFLKGLNEAAFGFSKWGVPPLPGAAEVQQDKK